MSKILCLGEVALHNLTEYLVKEEYITHYNDGGCPNGFRDIWTYSFDTNHRIYDKKYLLFCMVLFDKFLKACPSNFIYDKLIETGIIDEKFFYLDYVDYYKLYREEENYYKDIAVNFMQSNKKSLINYLSKDILHTNPQNYKVNPKTDYEAFINNPFHEGTQSRFNPNVFILTQIRDAMTVGLLLSQKTKKDKIFFYNGRLSYRNKSQELIYNQIKFNEYTN